MVKLAEDRFTLAVVGQFKRGKSSLMNAIIGRKILPTGILPVTSAVTILRFGPRERLLIPRPNTSPIEEAPGVCPAGIRDAGSQPGKPETGGWRLLELPLPFLRRGVEFVDTPGVGSAIDANTATTMSFLPRCDAAVFVTSVDTPMTAVETAFLADIRQHADKVFFVVNKIDLLEDREREKVLDYISHTIRQQTAAATIRIFPASSRLGLEARMAGDSEGYARSGLAALEEALAGFLSAEKSDALLVAVLNKSLRLTGQRPELLEIEKRLVTLRDIIAQHRASETTLREAAALEPLAPQGRQCQNKWRRLRPNGRMCSRRWRLAAVPCAATWRRPPLPFSLGGSVTCRATSRPSTCLPTNWVSVRSTPGSLPIFRPFWDSARVFRDSWNASPVSSPRWPLPLRMRPILLPGRENLPGPAGCAWSCETQRSSSLTERRRCFWIRPASRRMPLLRACACVTWACFLRGQRLWKSRGFSSRKQPDTSSNGRKTCKATRSSGTRCGEGCKIPMKTMPINSPCFISLDAESLCLPRSTDLL